MAKVFNIATRFYIELLSHLIVKKMSSYIKKEWFAGLHTFDTLFIHFCFYYLIHCFFN